MEVKVLSRSINISKEKDNENDTKGNVSNMSSKTQLKKLKKRVRILTNSNSK